MGWTFKIFFSNNKPPFPTISNLIVLPWLISASFFLIFLTGETDNLPIWAGYVLSSSFFLCLLSSSKVLGLFAVLILMPYLITSLSEPIMFLKLIFSLYFILLRGSGPILTLIRR